MGLRIKQVDVKSRNPQRRKYIITCSSIFSTAAFKSVDALGPPTGLLVPDRLKYGDNDLMMLSYVIKDSFQTNILGVTRVKTATREMHSEKRQSYAGSLRFNCR